MCLNKNWAFISFIILCLNFKAFTVVSGINEISTKNAIEELKIFIKQNFQELKNQLQEMENKLKIIENTENSYTLDTVYDENLNCIRNCTESNQLPTNCEAAMKMNSWKNTIYQLKILYSELPAFYAFCYYESGPGWTIIQRRKDGSENFYRNWHDYKNGFGNLFGEYWLGLERLYQMTRNQKYELWIRLEDFTGLDKYAFYSNFAIDSEENKYQLKIDGYKGTAGDSLNYHNGRNFSTYDQINSDSSTYNCAERGIGAWWFGNCGHSNLNGRYMSSGNQLTWLGVYWFHYHNSYGKSLQYTHMAIRPAQN